MTIPLYVLAHTPGATDTVEWTAICHLRTPSVIVHYLARRWTSRHVSHERKRPFDVCWSSGHRGDFSRLHHPVSSHATLEAALRAAKAFATLKETDR
jgi:hypothetical protein